MGWLILILIVAILAAWYLSSAKDREKASHGETKPPQIHTRDRVAKTTTPTAISYSSKWKHAPSEIFKEEYVSYTRINNFRICPRMFELIYLQGYEDHGGRAA